MSNRECTEELFLRDVQGHTMEVLRDDGVYRHLRFRKPRPASSSYWFDLITWPEMLCINGDMGTYVFSRLTDMFEFFRTDKRHDHQLGINLGYWAEKLKAPNSRAAEEFDSKKFDTAIKGLLIDWIKEHRGDTSKEERRDLWETVGEEVLNLSDDQDGNRKQAAAYDFCHQVNPARKFYFRDLFELDFQDYTFHFVWCCYAIAWGIQRYDIPPTKPPEISP